ncbi:MAG TPA: hypothetical protein VKV16_08980 [Solirubrobacteraceae bacterium]|nr:hypothetical protein [Solirubrobacteraceae bacterium]
MDTRRCPRPRPSRRLWRTLLALALLALTALALSGAIPSLQAAALTMLPALALAVLMLTRPYVGASAIGRWRRGHARRAIAQQPATAPLRAPTVLARGGRLLAAALADRAPPALLAGGR